MWDLGSAAMNGMPKTRLRKPPEAPRRPHEARQQLGRPRHIQLLPIWMPRVRIDSKKHVFHGGLVLGELSPLPKTCGRRRMAGTDVSPLQPGNREI
jgi:hypothetical protein